MKNSDDHPDRTVVDLAALRRRTPESPLADLSELYWPRYDELPRPVNWKAMADWHRVVDWGSWRSERMLAGEREFLLHGSHRTFYTDRGRRTLRPNLLIFHWRDGSFAVLKERSSEPLIHVWARTQDGAEQRFRALAARYRRRGKRCPPTSAAFKIIQAGPQGLSSRLIETEPPFTSEEDLRLHYSDGFVNWSDQLIARFGDRTTGLTLLQGAPGTGKTSYLRFLMNKLADSYLFYYVPISAYALLSTPAAISFWLEETKITKGKRVVILEDAEPMLMKRASDNHDCVSNLLNISDGFLGDVLKLQVICTINCHIAELDPALMRPGRLLASRQFARLTRAEAERLARAKGKTLQPQSDYSLAEIYCATAGSVAAETGTVGFAAGEYAREIATRIEARDLASA